MSSVFLFYWFELISFMVLRCLTATTSMIGATWTVFRGEYLEPEKWVIDDFESLRVVRYNDYANLRVARHLRLGLTKRPGPARSSPAPLSTYF